MPFLIRKLPGKNLYRVKMKSGLRPRAAKGRSTGKILSYGTTLKKAKAQIRYLYMINRMSTKKR